MTQRIAFILGACLAGFGSAGAQDHIEMRAAVPAQVPAQHTIDFLKSEFGPVGPVVKGAPYTAEAVTETVQTLADGNRIVRRNTTQVARDGEGRTRRDLAFVALGPMASAETPKISIIYDPVANVSYTLNHTSKTANKMPGRGMMVKIASMPPTAAQPVAGQQVYAPEAATSPSGVVAMRGKVLRAATEGGHDVVFESGPGPFRVERAPEGRQESLGKRNIEGVMAEGTRTTSVIPAGQIGNERPIEIVSERWYSPELQTVVKSSHRDPRIGETTYSLTNLRLGEPVKSLFEVPPDYKLTDTELPPLPAVPGTRVPPPGREE